MLSIIIELNNDRRFSTVKYYGLDILQCLECTPVYMFTNIEMTAMHLFRDVDYLSEGTDWLPG